MIAIDVADLVVIAGELYGTGPDAALDRIDLDAARAALTEAAPADGPPTAAAPADTALTKDALAAAATRLIRALLRHHPFPADGQQLAVLAGLQFLALNGWQADLDPPGTALVLVEGLASGQLSLTDAAAWLSSRLSPYSTPPVREAPAGPGRGGGPRPRLHRHRAHPAGPVPRGRRHGGPGAGQPRRERERGMRRGHRPAHRGRPDRPRAAPGTQARLA